MDELPDEVLLQVFIKLSTSDLLNVASLSKRFNRILCEKRLVRKLDLRRCYSSTNNIIAQFLSDQRRHTNIVELNFNGCWWLTFTELKVVSELKNLKSLHLLQCLVDWDLLTKLISNLRLETFAFTLPSEHNTSISPCKYMESLASSLAGVKNLFFEVLGPLHLSHIGYILAVTKNLEILEIREAEKDGRKLYDLNLLWCDEYITVGNWRLLSLKECRLFLYENFKNSIESFLTAIIRSYANGSANIKGIWSSQHCCDVLAKLNHETTLQLLKNVEFISLSHSFNVQKPDFDDHELTFAKTVLQNTLPNCKCLSLDRHGIDDGVMQLIANECPQLECLCLINTYLERMTVGTFTNVLESCTNISELCLYDSCLHYERDNPCTAIGKLKKLKVLMLSSCALGRSAKQEQPDFDNGNSRFYSIAENCTKLHTLIIRRQLPTTQDRSDCDNYISSIKSTDLLCIATLYNLVTLELGEMPSVHKEPFLSEICRNCALQDLRLIDIGSKPDMANQNSLTSVLNLCTELKYLHIEQSYDLEVFNLKQSLFKCKKLETLKIVLKGSYDGQFDNTWSITAAIDELPELVDFWLVQPNYSVCKQIFQRVDMRYKFRRPAFRCKTAKTKSKIVVRKMRYFPLHINNSYTFS